MERTFRTQESLNSLGYDAGVSDGLMGPRTRKALAAFQRAQGLPVTSEINEETIAALAAAREQGSAPQAAARETISILGADFPVLLDDGRLAEIPAEWEEVKPYIPEWLLAAPETPLDNAARLRLVSDVEARTAARMDAAIGEVADRIVELNQGGNDSNRSLIVDTLINGCLVYDDSNDTISPSTRALCQERLALSFVTAIITASTDAAGSLPPALSLVPSATPESPEALESAVADIAIDEYPDFESTDEPDHEAMLQLYMAANADLLDNEAFAWEHYSVRHAPRGRSKECTALILALENQFEREKWIEEARRLLKPALRQSATEPKARIFKLRGRISLKDYDRETQAFPYSTIFNTFLYGGQVDIARSVSEGQLPGRGYYSGPVANLCPARLDVIGGALRRVSGTEVMPKGLGGPRGFSLSVAPEPRISRLPMAPNAAEAFIGSLAIRRPEFILETLVEVGPAAFDKDSPGMIPARTIAARAIHPTTGNVIHTFDLPAPAVEGANHARFEAGRAGTDHRGDETVTDLTDYQIAGLALNSHPVVLTPDLVQDMTERQVLFEQSCARSISEILSDDSGRLSSQRFHPEHPLIAYDWQSARNKGDIRPNIEALFRDGGADWDFVRAAPGFDPRFRQYVQISLFDPTATEGRDSSFAAAELSPIFREHLDSVFRTMPSRFKVLYPLGPLRYEIEEQAYVPERAGRISLLPVSERADENSVLNVFGYKASDAGYLRTDIPSDPVGERIECRGYSRWTATTMWRQLIAETLKRSYRPILRTSVDLRVPSIRVERAEAEALSGKLNSSGEGFLASVTFEVAGTVLVPSVDGRKVPTLEIKANVRTVDIITKDGTLAASVSLGDLVSADEAKAAAAEREKIVVPDLPAPSSEPRPLTAETMDLLVWRYAPGSIGADDLNQLVLTRWDYENEALQSGFDPEWGGFFLREVGSGLTILDRPSKVAEPETLARFREWSRQRAESLPDRFVIHLQELKLREGTGNIIYPTGLTVDQRMKAYSDVASCRREHSFLSGRRADAKKVECDRLALTLEVLPKTIELVRWGAPSAIGPRRMCGSASAGKDPYCESRKAATKGSPVVDVFVVDRLVRFPENAAAPASLSIDIEVAIEGVEIGDSLPDRDGGQSHAGRSGALNALPDGTRVFTWQVSAKAAQAFGAETGEAVATLSLYEASTLEAEIAGDSEGAGVEIERDGPDLVGLQLGMSMEEAEEAIRQHMKVGLVLHADRRWPSERAEVFPEPFSSGKMFISTDDSEMIIIYNESPAVEDKVVGIVRQVRVPKGTILPAAVYKIMRDKYGPEAFSEKQAGDRLYWGDRTDIFDERLNILIGKCVPLSVTSHKRKLWRTEDGKFPDARFASRSDNTFPDIEATGFPRDVSIESETGHAWCSRVLAGEVDTVFGGSFDSINTWLLDIGTYYRAWRSSAVALKEAPPAEAVDAVSSGIKF